jgi:GGDEF domain-containing protein
VSAGLATYPHEGVTADALFRLADERLYEAKRAKVAD